MRIIDIPEFRDKAQMLTLPPESKVVEACSAMAEKRYGSALIVNKEHKLIGIFTERDLLNKVIAKGLDPKEVALAQVMTQDIKVAHPFDSVNDSLRRMSQGKFRHLPVIDDNGNLIGIVSQGDFLALTWGEIFHHLGRNAKSSFLDFTQVWLLFASFILYTLTLILFLQN